MPVDVRLEKFKEKAVPLVSDVARRAIKEAGLNVSDISKLVVVSSTGFLGPGLDCELIKNLGLTRSVDRTLIGFMGCAAAMNGFRNANDYVTVSPVIFLSMVEAVGPYVCVVVVFHSFVSYGSVCPCRRSRNVCSFYWYHAE